MAADLSILIVAYKCRDALADCLASVAPGEHALATETIVVENAGADGTVEMVRAQFAWARLIANETNRGFAAANNQGLAGATGRHVLFLNPDTIVRPGALEALVRTLDGDPKIGACGPQLLGADGSVQPSARRLPTFAALLHQYTALRPLRILKRAYGRYKMADFDFRTARDVETLMGAALAVPRRVLQEVGGMDERFFVYLEEVDLCRRIRAAGYRVRFEPAGRVRHLGGVSAASTPSQLFFCRSMFAYIRKYHGRLAGGLMVLALLAGMFLREAALLAGNLLAALFLAIVGRAARADRRRARARAAARFLLRDGWRACWGDGGAR